MNRKNFTKIIIVLLAITSMFSFTSSLVSTPVESETLEEQLKRIEQELNSIQEEKNRLQDNLNTQELKKQGYSDKAAKIYGEIMMFQKNIDSLDLEIQELEVNIQIIEKKVAVLQKDIEDSLMKVSELESESKDRIQASYISFRTSGQADQDQSAVFNTDSINKYFKDSQYISFIQDQTNSMMSELARLKLELDLKKSEMNEKLTQISASKQALETKKADLAKRRDELEIEKNSYAAEIAAIQNQINEVNGSIWVFSQEEAQKQTQAEQVRYAIFSTFNPPNQGEYVTAGRPIGIQGCTGLCTGAHLHFSIQENGGWRDPCAYLPAGGPVSGCGWGDRLAQWPISGGGFYYTSAFGDRCFDWGGSLYCDTHLGTDFAGPANSVIYAAHNGYLYRGTDPYGANYAIICENTNCNVGVKSGYWHLQ